MAPATRFSLSNESLACDFDWSDGPLRCPGIENKRSGRRFTLADDRALTLAFSAALDRVAEPLLPVDDFAVRTMRAVDAQHVVFALRSPSTGLEAEVHFQLEGHTRRKWAEVKNTTAQEMLLLDATLDDFASDWRMSGGGKGEPIFVADEGFAAIEHPSGINEGKAGRVRMLHHPGKGLPAGSSWKSATALVSMAPSGQAREHFLSYIQSKSQRGEKVISIYTPFGINNMWGSCGTLTDDETLDVLKLLKKFQARGLHFDYFVFDAGWIDPNSDMTRFNPTAFPDGPQKIVDEVRALGMDFGLWFATTWAAFSCWGHPPALAGQASFAMPYRLGYPDKPHATQSWCFAQPALFQTLKQAVLSHIRQNAVRFIKFDGNYFGCDRADHGHLPGVYAVEMMHEQLMDLCLSAKAAAPDVRVMLYYGCSSPFWALYGDFIFESGLPMEGSATSEFPSIKYRDSVTLMQDKGAQNARNIPPLIKDGLGVWLADNRWGNYMGKERWREALVMDLGRGQMLFPNLWGDLYLLDDEDVDFIAGLGRLAKQNQALFAHRRTILGQPGNNDVYGYAHCEGNRGFLFINNVHFAARQAEVPLDETLGLGAPRGSSVHVVAHFPDRERLPRPGGGDFKLGDTLNVWLRPFEVLLLEVTSASASLEPLPLRSVNGSNAAGFGTSLILEPEPLDPHFEMNFADAARFAEKKLAKKTYSFATRLPAYADAKPPVLAITVQLRQDGKEWRHAPVDWAAFAGFRGRPVVEIVQVLAKIGDQDVQLIPMPESRQTGNTQGVCGASWVTYKVRLGRQWSGGEAHLAVHACLPDGVEAHVEGWVVKSWSNDSARPSADGYSADAPF